MAHNAFKRGDPNRLRIFRGVLMTLLYTATQGDIVNVDDPNAVSADVLLSSLETLSARPGDDELRNAANYLEQKGYIKVAWLRDGSSMFGSVRLQAAGMDLVERTSVDAGVMFSQRR